MWPVPLRPDCIWRNGVSRLQVIHKFIYNCYVQDSQHARLKFRLAVVHACYILPITSTLYFAFIVGLLAVLLDIPFDIMGIKLLWWTWHDTDPNIFDRSYWVPWTSYYFHASFSAALCFVFHGSRALFSSQEKFISAGYDHYDNFEYWLTLVDYQLSQHAVILQYVPCMLRLSTYCKD